MTDIINVQFPYILLCIWLNQGHPVQFWKTWRTLSDIYERKIIGEPVKQTESICVIESYRAWMLGVVEELSHWFSEH